KQCLQWGDHQEKQIRKVEKIDKSGLTTGDPAEKIDEVLFKKCKVGELLTMVSNKIVGMRCQQSFMEGYAHAVR
ncbi:MAG: hypothetical protein EZS28_025601, partial [Streblomastix strix]